MNDDRAKEAMDILALIKDESYNIDRMPYEVIDELLSTINYLLVQYEVVQTACTEYAQIDENCSV